MTTYKIDIFLTKQLFGEKLEKIAEVTDEADKLLDSVMNKIDKFKDDSENKKKYRIEPYNRLLYSSENTDIAIDFGDYQYFLLVVGFPKRA